VAFTSGLLLSLCAGLYTRAPQDRHVGAGPVADSEAHSGEVLTSVPEVLLTRPPVGADSFLSALETGRSEATRPLSGTPHSSEPGLAPSAGDSTGEQLVSWTNLPGRHGGPPEPLRIDYSMDPALTQRIFKVLKRGRVSRGHVLVMDPQSGRLIAYASTDPDGFPATRAYPAASLVKVVTAAAALHYAPDEAREPCRYRGNPYRLTPTRVYPPSSGREISLERALATSNNQCFAQLAVNSVGGEALLTAFASFGLVEAPAPGHSPGTALVGDDDYDLGRLGSGLGGCHITPLHAVQLAATLADGERVAPWWIDRITDVHGRVLPLPPRPATRRVMTPELAAELRRMLVRTTTRGTARSAFRDRRGRPRLGKVLVAGKTGNLTGKEPKGRYEWFIGAAPAHEPTVAIAVLQVQGHLWWRKSSEIAADVLYDVFCERGRCDADLATRYTGHLGKHAAPVFLSESGDASEASSPTGVD